MTRNGSCRRTRPGPRGFVDVPAGIAAIGHEGEGFCFDNETPRHDELIPTMRIARHLVSNAEWLEFIDAGGYATPSLWLSDGWARRRRKAGRRPAIGGKNDGAWYFDDARRPASRSIRRRRSCM